MVNEATKRSRKQQHRQQRDYCGAITLRPLPSRPRQKIEVAAKNVTTIQKSVEEQTFSRAFSFFLDIGFCGEKKSEDKPSSIVAVLAFSLSHIWKVLTGLYLPDSRVVVPTPLLSFTAVLLVLEMCHNKMMGKKHHLSIKIFFLRPLFLLHSPSFLDTG